MPSKRQQQAGFLLPDPIRPYDLVCVTMLIPNAPEYRQAFIGHLFQLTKWYSWHKTYIPGDTTASQAAEYWREVLTASLQVGQDEDDCGVLMAEFRTNPDDSCQLQYRPTPLDEWTTIFDACDCDCPKPYAYRYNEEGILEYQYEEGGEWFEAKDQDPRYTGAREPNYDLGDNPPCLVAVNIIAWYTNLVDEISDAIDNAGTAVTIATFVVSLFLVLLSGGSLLPLVIPLVSLMLTLGSAGIAAAFTPGFYDELKCLIMCILPEDGSISEDTYNTIMQAIDAESGIAWEATSYAFRIAGAVGLHNMGHAGGITSVTTECDDCECEDCETLNLPVTSPAQVFMTHNTNIGTDYLITISGTAKIGQDAPSGEYTGDAWYYRTTVNPTWLAIGGNFGVLINGFKPSPVPSFQADHIYVVQAPGNGSPFYFQFNDPSYVENVGSLTIEVCPL